MDDPTKLIRVSASDGKSGDSRELAYTNCKVIGNGSFGVVFQARLVSGGNGNLVEGAGASAGAGEASKTPREEQEDVAIKKVLQDKRFKVRARGPVRGAEQDLTRRTAEPRAADHAHRRTPQRRGPARLLLLKWRQGEQPEALLCRA